MTEPPDEWLRTDGAGGWAMGTPSGINTRRYHAIWMPARKIPAHRIVGLRTVMDEAHLSSGEILALTRGHFGAESGLHPENFASASSVDLDGDEIVWHFDLPGGGRLSRSLRLEWNAVMLRWSVEGPPVKLVIRPLTTMRNAHHLLRAPAEDLHVGRDGDDLHVNRGELRLTFTLEGGGWLDEGPNWWHDHRFPEESRRGYDDTESALAIGAGEAVLSGGQSLALIGRIDRPQPAWPAPDPPRDRLSRAAAQFLVLRGDRGMSIIAGYPWFADWGRDAMISLPGLLLTSGRLDEARRVLETWAGAMHNGLIPNRFDDIEDGAHYNSADASLWFIQALCAWLEAGGNSPDLLDCALQIVDAYQQGTDMGIGVRDGLVEAGAEGLALTWMDAVTDGVAITPRRGRPVELSALWYDALLKLADLVPARRDDLAAKAQLTASAFDLFWNESAGCCFDVLAHEPDPSIRPNQVIACSLRHSPLSPRRRNAIVDLVARTLLTPFGLRTLDPVDPRYIGACDGDQRQRDLAYHNGTVWPWLIGPWLDARARLGLDWSLPRSLLQTLDSGCHGQLAEIFDGDAPHVARGCPAQAWSVAEVLRRSHEEGRPHAPACDLPRS